MNEYKAFKIETHLNQFMISLKTLYVECFQCVFTNPNVVNDVFEQTNPWSAFTL